MSLSKLTDSDKQFIGQWYESKTYQQIADTLGRSKSSVQRYVERLRRAEKISVAGPITNRAIEMNVLDDLERTYIKSTSPKTLDELIEVCEIDLEEFEIISYEVNKWEVSAMGEELVTMGGGLNAVKRGKMETTPLFQIKVKLAPRKPNRIQVKEFVKLLAQDIKELSVKPALGPVPAYIAQTDHQCLLELDPFDMHFGKFCYAPETVTNFDLNLASDLFEYATNDLLQKSSGFGIERSLIVIGNDVTHIDGPKNQTFAGTTMDVDTRFTKIFRRAHKLHSWAIRRLLLLGPVHVLVMPGNHDTTTAWHLGHVLETEFGNDPNVTVDNQYRARKYFAYGNTLLGFTHGDKGRENELPLQMAREVPEMWAKSEFREWHRGHLHKYSETKWRASESYAGVIVRTLNTLTAHDKWHTDEGYMDRRAMQAFVHHKTAGIAAMLSSNVIHHTGKPA